MLLSLFRVISGLGDLGLSHWRPESQTYNLNAPSQRHCLWDRLKECLALSAPSPSDDLRLKLAIPSLERGKKTPTPKITALLRKSPSY